MKSIFVFWSEPMFSSESKGYNKDRNPEEIIKLHDFEIEIQKLSALSAKKYVGETTLYTDTNGFDYLSKLGLVDYYDNVDITLLNECNKLNFNKGYFWTSGKTYVICNQTEPFTFLDLDFIVKDYFNIDGFKKYDCVHTQWELQRNKFYVDESKLKSLNLPYYYTGMLYPNTSFLYINNTTLLSEYWKLHESIIYNKNLTKVDESIWLMADQGILPFTFRKLKSKVACLEPFMYIEDGERIQQEIKYGIVPHKMYYKNSDVIDLKYYHVWLEKSQLLKNKNKKSLFLKDINLQIKNISKPKTIL